MEKIVISIDNHTTIVDANDINELSSLISRPNVHFYESPFVNFQQLTSGEYWSDRIIQDKSINEKFDIKNYIKIQWENWDKWNPKIEIKTAEERLADAKCWAELSGLDFKDFIGKSEVIPTKKLPLP